MLSIVIPTDNWENSYFQQSLIGYENNPNVEIIQVDVRIAPTRAERLNIGFHLSKGDIVLFHHPRTLLAPGAIEHLIKVSEEKKRSYLWGGFIHQFDKDHFMLRCISWYSNYIRSKWKGIVYLDHCVFFDRLYWNSDLEKKYIFEDTELSLMLRKFSHPVLLPYKAVTSAHRFQKNGILKQIVLNQILKLGFYLRIPSKFLFSLYQK
ncbi:hypothetical protein P3G55_00860 [Leptospira sp. 96542]|nr:hypothetical protein [Leptospira sp. 96542]